jgi:dethiobiotin synthetase
MPKGFFITGTDTGVGKTIVAAALIRALKASGLSSCGMKPIETGCKRDADGSLVPLDGRLLLKVSEVDETQEDVTPYCFDQPLAPMVAAEVEMRSMDMLWVERAYERLSERYDAVVVEGIGGLLVPIQREYSVLDLARYLNLPVIVVASPYLGTINHTLLTVDRALSEGLTVAGVVVNFSRLPVELLAEETNPRVIKELSPVPVLGVMPYISVIDAETLEAAAMEHLDIEALAPFLADVTPNVQPEIPEI